MFRILQFVRNFFQTPREELEKELVSVQQRIKDISKEIREQNRINKEKTEQAVDLGSKHEMNRRLARWNAIKDNLYVLKALKEQEAWLIKRLERRDRQMA